jgi:DNA repair exonuclease SbcCD ATPase subunit
MNRKEKEDLLEKIENLQSVIRGDTQRLQEEKDSHAKDIKELELRNDLVKLRTHDLAGKKVFL